MGGCGPQVHYHLDSLDDALKYALGAGQYFDVATKSEYVDTLIGERHLPMNSLSAGSR